MDIKNPHDRFFKETFSDIEAAQDFISGTFPESIVKKLDLSTLELDANTYTDNKLKEHFADYSVSAKNLGSQRKAKHRTYTGYSCCFLSWKRKMGDEIVCRLF